uniref:ZU5 domain-containing protein n=1 Tax=Knipowitschia caucasica TaxID=637954 RepID=A0AAV2MPC4_KNICA
MAESLCLVSSLQTLEGCEVLLGPEVTYGPPGLDLLSPVALTMAHCAEMDSTDHWNIQLKRRTPDSKWERAECDGCTPELLFLLRLSHQSDHAQGERALLGGRRAIAWGARDEKLQPRFDKIYSMKQVHISH